MFQDKVVVITGGANGIGKCIAQEFEKNGAHVCVIDKEEGPHYVGDIAEKEVLEDFAKNVIAQYGHVDYLVNNAMPITKGISSCSYEEFEYAQRVGVTAPFYSHLSQQSGERFSFGQLYFLLSSPDRHTIHRIFSQLQRQKR